MGLAGLVFAGAALVASGARAQTGEAAPPAGAEAEAQALFAAGRAAFDDARYAEALTHFEGALSRSGRAALHYNVGLCHDRLGNDEAALAAFDAFMGTNPEGALRREVEQRLEVLRRRLTAASASEAGAPAPARGGPGALPWIVLATGGALVVGGGVLFTLGLSDVGAVEDAPTGTAWGAVQARADRGETFQAVGGALAAAGLAAAAVGAVWLVLGAPDAGPGTDVAVSVGPGAIGVGGRF